uniref:Uncharacterized protein n=1 Tax=Branchiostoma floridae TaxID=7739 RepID=C3ZLZ5_BRAFL|eukprot:XP_002590465.1 hypothetical protein BRAFLDRAFT_86318 [Branchiostoma floridae]
MSGGTRTLRVEAEIHSSDRDDSTDKTTDAEMCTKCGRPVKDHVEAGNEVGSKCVWRLRAPPRRKRAAKRAADSQEPPGGARDATSPPEAAPEESSPSNTVSQDEIARLQAQRDKLLRQYEATRLQQEIAGLQAALGTSAADLAPPPTQVPGASAREPSAPAITNVPPPITLQDVKHQPRIQTALRKLSTSVDFLNDILGHSTDGDEYHADQETIDTDQWSPSSSFVQKDRDPNSVASRTGYMRRRLAIQSQRLRQLSRIHGETRVGIDHVRDWLENSHAAHPGDDVRSGSTDSESRMPARSQSFQLGQQRPSALNITRRDQESRIPQRSQSFQLGQQRPTAFNITRRDQEFPSTSTQYKDKRISKHSDGSRSALKGDIKVDEVFKAVGTETTTTDASQGLTTSEEASRRRSNQSHHDQPRKQQDLRSRNRESKTASGVEDDVESRVDSAHSSGKQPEKQDVRRKKETPENHREPRSSSRGTKKPVSPPRSPRRRHSTSRSRRRHHSPSRSPSRRQKSVNPSRRDTPRRAKKNEQVRSRSVDVNKKRSIRDQRPSARDRGNLRGRVSTGTSSDGKPGFVKKWVEQLDEGKDNLSSGLKVGQRSEGIDQKSFFDGFKGSFLHLVGSDEQKEKSPMEAGVTGWGEDTGRSHRKAPDDSGSLGFLGDLTQSLSLSWDKDGKIQEDRNRATPFIGSFAGGEDGGNQEHVGFLRSLGQTFGVSPDESKQQETPAWTDDIKAFIFGSREDEDAGEDDKARADLNILKVFGKKDDKERGDGERRISDMSPEMLSQMSERRGQKAEEESSFWTFLGIGGSDDREPATTNSSRAAGRQGDNPTRRGDNPVRDFFVDLF